jgi:glucose/arabinose dehydrogenase
MKKFLLLAIFVASCIYCSAQITLTSFATGFSSPLDIKHAGDKRLFVVQQGGIIKIVDTTGAVYPTNFLNITSRVLSGGERGLLGLAFDPNYSANGFFYVNYTRQPDGHTRISRFQVSPSNPDTADPNSEQILLTIYQPYSNHNGGHIAFGPDGYLYIGMGDGGSGGDPQNRAQNKDSLLGKMLRIDVSDTSLAYINPPTNPYYGAIPGRDEIWALGLRNPWRFSFDRWNGDLWIGDVGQNAWEEVDYQPASSAGGENYGWRCYEGNAAYNTTGCGPISNYVFPVRVIAHASGVCSVTGGYVYRGAEYSNLWNKYFYTDYCTNAMGVHSISHVGSNFYDSVAVAPMAVNFASLGEDKYGELYFASLNGTVYKMYGVNCSPVAFISEEDTIYGCTNSIVNLRTPEGRGFHYEWTFNGSPISNSDTSAIVVTTDGWYSVTTTDRNACTAVSDSVYVLMQAPPTVSITGADSVYCANDSAVTLTGIPAGGTFSGPGISGNMFDPAIAPIGYDTIIYSYTDTSTGCSNIATAVILVNSPPLVFITGVNSMYCNYDSAVVMTGNPPGGVFSGPGVSGNTFDPSTAPLGNDTITYTFTDSSTNCSNSTSIVIQVNAPPTLSITGVDTLYCVYDPVVTLTGNPAGGTFSGPGVSGNTFDPAAAGIGYDTIMYAYTDSVSGCSNTVSMVIHVDACLGIGDNSPLISMGLYPNPNNGTFTLGIVTRNELKLKMEIADVLGKVVSKKEISLSAGSNSISLKNTLAKGVYQLKLQGENVSTIRSFVVK